MTHTFDQDPDAVLDYLFDWSSWLADGETITSATVFVHGVTLDSNATTAADTAVRAWLSGGTAGTAATATCRITTNQGRTDDRTIVVRIMER